MSSLGLALLLAHAAQAQHCALPDPAGGGDVGLRVSAAAVVGTFETERFTGELQGGVFSVAWAHPWVALRAAQPVYRVTRNGPTSSGVGDLTLDVWPTVYRGQELSAGLRLGATAPLGDADQDLGMGHSMLTAGVWLAATLSPAWRLVAELGYSRALVASLGEHQHGPAPLVDPMNASEVTGAARATVTLGRFALHASLSGALPAGLDDGEARGSLALGGAVRWDRIELGVEGAFPVVGDPFEARLTVQLSLLL